MSLLQFTLDSDDEIESEGSTDDEVDTNETKIIASKFSFEDDQVGVLIFFVVIPRITVIPKLVL